VINPIILCDVEAATNADILNGTRLATAPYNGIMTFKIEADLNTAAANYTITVALPGGDVPIDAQRVPASGAAAVGVLDDREAFIVSFAVQQGGQVLFSCVETGAALLAWLVRFAPA